MNEKPATNDGNVNDAVESPCATPIACNARSEGAPRKRSGILRQKRVVSTNGSSGKKPSLLRRRIVSWALKGKRSSGTSNSDSEHQPSNSTPFWNR